MCRQALAPTQQRGHVGVGSPLDVIVDYTPRDLIKLIEDDVPQAPAAFPPRWSSLPLPYRSRVKGRVSIHPANTRSSEHGARSEREPCLSGIVVEHLNLFVCSDRALNTRPIHDRLPRRSLPRSPNRLASTSSPRRTGPAAPSRPGRRGHTPGGYGTAHGLQFSRRRRQLRRQCGHERHVLLLGKQAYPEAGRDYRGALVRPKTGDAPAKLQYILFGVMYTINQTSSLQLHAMHA